MATGMHALSHAERETALCARGPLDLTPLAEACDAGDARAVSELLSLGAARSIFVQGFRSQELLCTLPYTPVVPERHASAKGRALAEQRREVCENSQALAAAGDVKALVDAALADYITQLAAGAVEFAVGVESEGVARDDDVSSASTVSASPSPAKPPAPRDTDAEDEVRKGDLVRLKRGLEGSSIMVSRLNTDNSVASRACLGAAKLRRLGVVVRAASDADTEIIWVACVSSGHVCEYLRSDLVFADGSALDALHPASAPPKPASKKGKPDVSGSPPAMPGTQVRTISAKEGAPRGKSTMSFSEGQVYTIKDMTCEDGKWFATSTRWETLWFPLDSTDAVQPKAIKLVKDTATPLEPKRMPFKIDDIVTMAPGAFAAATLVLSGEVEHQGKCLGVYAREAGRTVHGRAVWRHEREDRWIATSPKGYWMVQNEEDVGVNGTGFLLLPDAKAAFPHQSVVAWKECPAAGKGFQAAPGLKCAADPPPRASADAANSFATPPEEGSLQPAPLQPAQWMPAAGELLVVCSIFHQMSTRGILVCSLTDARRLWVASVPDLMSVRAASCSHVFRAGDLVQLDGGVKGACEGKCLGTPGQGRVGRVISAGIVRNGLQRNIEVAYVNERAAGGEDGGDSKGDVAVSLYSAGDLLPAPPIRYASASMTADERQGLIECLEALSHTTKTALAPVRIVDKFGLDVFSRLWRLFADTKEGYWAALKAFQTWHLRRLEHVAAKALLPDATMQLVTYRQSYQCQSAMASALRECVPCAGEEASGVAETWTCDSCCIVNPAECASCRVCDEQMPTWKCVRCVQVNSCTRAVCRHCHTPLGSAATHIAHGGSTGQTRAVAAPVAAGNDGAGSPAQAQALLGGRSVVFFDESPGTMQRGESKQGPASDAEPSAPWHNFVNLRWSSSAKAKPMEISGHALTATGSGWVRTETAVPNGEVATWQLKLSAGVEISEVSHVVGVLDGRYDAWMNLRDATSADRAWYFEKQSFFDGKGRKRDGRQYFKQGDTLELQLDRTGPTGVLSLTVHNSVVAQIKGLPSDVALFPAVAISRQECRCSFTLSEAGLGQHAGECQDGRKCGSSSLDLAAAPCCLDLAAALTPAAESPGRDPSTYYGCRVQVKSAWCDLKGKCGRILSVVSPAARTPTSEQGPWDQFTRDAVGRIVIEDGAVRMQAAGKAQVCDICFGKADSEFPHYKFCAKYSDAAPCAMISTAAGGAAASVAPSSAMTTLKPDMICMCEFRLDGKLQVLPVGARNLSWLPGKPSNFPLPDQTSDGPGQADDSDAIAGQNSNAGQGGTESPWQVGALVRLLDTPSSGSSDLAPGRGPRSIGCISAVHLEDNKVSVCVYADAESCLSDCGDVKIGAEVRLAIGYAAVQNASKGPLVAGQKGSVKALQDGLVLVESIGQDNVKWWYEPETLVLAGFFSVKITGVGSGKGDVVNGTFFPVPGEVSGGKTVYKEEHRDAWIEFDSSVQKWLVKSGENKGTTTCWMQSKACGDTNTVDEVTCGWQAYNGSTKKWEDQTDVKVEAINENVTMNLTDLTDLQLVLNGNMHDLPVLEVNEWINEWRSAEKTAAEQATAATTETLTPLTVSDLRSIVGHPKVVLLRKYTYFEPYVEAGTVGVFQAISSGVRAHVDFPGRTGACPEPQDIAFFPDEKAAAEKAAKEDVGSKEQAKMGASDVPPYPEDEAIVNDILFNAGRKQETQAKGLEATPQCHSAAKLMREDSSPFYENCDVYKVISNFQDFVSWRDRGGNTVAHHLAMADMPRSLKALYAETKESRWVENDVFETPQTVSDCVQTITPRQSVLHRALHDGNLLRTGSAPVPVVLIRAALRWPEEENCDESAPDVRKMETALANGRPDEVLVLACQASDRPEGRLYSALAMLELKYSPKQVQLEIRQYLEAVLEDGGAGVSPLLYYIRFRLYQQQASKSAQGRQQAACAVAALRCFPAFAARWLRDQDSVMVQQLVDRQRTDVDSGDEEDFAEDVEECGTAAEWRVAKADHQLKSKSMDELMGLTGLRQIKRQAMGIVKEVLLQRDRPASVKAQTSMNFLFTGNPGCGKTTVARLLANCLSELGFRTKGIVETSAQDILKLKCPAGDFQTMLESAKGGTLFIDEAYHFSPAGASQQPNASNQVLDLLLEVVEKQEIRDTTTVILAGYGDEIEDLLSYNVGFASRFPLEFRFEDYDHKQLRAILHTMVKARGMQLQRKSVCGVAISDVVARRIHQGAGRKGFGNARAVRNKLEQIVSSQSQRIGTLKLRKQPVSEKDYYIITALDAIGPRPNFACCAPVRDLNAMAGLNAVKAEFRKLLLMAQQNYDREMKGDAPESISLHRVFYGNPGTGKSTVARLYGALLKELGLLSKGDFIAVTPADLTGDAEGGAAANTRAVLERAKGKVLLIDEAYILDPRRKNNQYGGNVLDTLVEKLDGEAGADIAVILAGYKQEMFNMLDNNPGLRRRFNIDDFGMHFQDMSDEELKQVLVAMASNCGLVFENLDLVDAVVALVAQKRRMPGFGNAGTVGSMLNFAKASKAARLDQAQQAVDEARRQQGAEVPTLPDSDVLVRSDFIPQEVDVEQARDAFASLYNVEHIMQLMDNFEAIIMAATADGLEPADILADAHMVFVGPPGTGKTTVANRFGKLFKDLKVLPSDTVTCVTGTSLMGQYVGETKEKVLRAMNQARGGILFIDEAYGLSGSSTGSSSFGREAIDTLVGNITQAEFKGNLLVIMAGYEHCMDALFANANPGFSSRFNKKRVVFEPWTAQQAGDAVISEIVRCDKTVTPEAEAAVHDWCRLLEPLPSWGSARDVFDAILPALYTERASRLRAASKHASPGAISTSSAYQAEDVNAALAPITMSRRKLALAESKPVCYTPPMRTATPGGCGSAADNGFPGADAGAETCQTNPKHKVKHKIRRIDNHDEDAEDEAPEPDVWAALEQACQELGYDIEYIAQFLEEGEYPQELLDKIVSITACNDVGKIRSMLDQQKGAFQKRLQLLIEHRLKEKSEEEARCQQKLQRMGRCPMDFEWLKEDGGWRCAGGSHYVSDADVSQFDA